MRQLCSLVSSTSMNACASRWRISGSSRPRSAVAARALRQTQQLVEQDAVHDELARRRAALVAERRLRDLPAAVQLADEVLGRHAHVVEEDLVELLAAGHLPQRPNGDARAVHVDDEEADALRLRRGADRCAPAGCPSGELRVAGPHLLAVDDEVVAVALGLAAQRGEVGAGVGLGEELAPDLLGREDLGRWRCFCASVPWAISVGPTRLTPMRPMISGAWGARHLLLQDVVLDDRRAAPAVLRAASARRPSRRRSSRALPFDEERDFLGQRLELRHLARQLAPARRAARRGRLPRRGRRTGPWINGIGRTLASQLIPLRPSLATLRDLVVRQARAACAADSSVSAPRRRAGSRSAAARLRS